MITCCLFQRLRYVILFWHLLLFFFLSNYEVCTSKTQVIQEGSDITLVGWGAQLSIMQHAIMEAEKVSLR